MARLLDDSEALTRRDLARLPRGTFVAEDFIDDDGLGSGPFAVRVAVTVGDDGVVCDFTGSHPQVRGPINTGRTGLLSGVRSAFKALTDPSDTRQRRAASGPCAWSAPTARCSRRSGPPLWASYFETTEYVTDLVWHALAPHMPEPDRLPAGHFTTVCSTILAGTHPQQRRAVPAGRATGGRVGRRAHPRRHRRPVLCRRRRDLQYPGRSRRGALRHPRQPVRACTPSAPGRGGIAAGSASSATTRSSAMRRTSPPSSAATAPRRGGWTAARPARPMASRSSGATARARCTAWWRACGWSAATWRGSSPGRAAAAATRALRPREAVAADVRDGYVTPEDARRLYGVEDGSE